MKANRHPACKGWISHDDAGCIPRCAVKAPPHEFPNAHRGSSMTVGIDLGTTNSLVGFWRDGAVTLVPNSLWRAHAVRRRDQRPAPKASARMKLVAGHRCPAEDPELLVFLELLL